MKEDKVFNQLKEKMILIADLPPQEIGPFTCFWKSSAFYFKTMTLPLLISTGLFSSLTLWFIFGPRLVNLVSILQYGF